MYTCTLKIMIYFIIQEVVDVVECTILLHLLQWNWIQLTIWYTYLVSLYIAAAIEYAINWIQLYNILNFHVKIFSGGFQRRGEGRRQFRYINMYVQCVISEK